MYFAATRFSFGPFGGSLDPFWGDAAGAYSRATLGLPPRCQIVSACFCLFFRVLTVARTPRRGLLRPVSRHVHAAIDVQRLAGDVARRRRAEEKYRLGDV